MKLALLGGSFNPVHRGHVALAASVIELLSYDKILLIPARMSPHKREVDYISPEHRLRMLELAFAGKGWAEVSRCEIDRSGPSYTVDTIHYIYENYTFEGKPGLIVGDDWISGFSQWKYVDTIVKKTDLIVAKRDRGDEFFSYACTFLQNPVVSVSSTEIRRCRREGLPINDYVSTDVADYMESHGLYTA